MRGKRFSSVPHAPGVAGSIFVAAFGVLWTILAISITADSPFPLVGVIFPLFGVCFVGFAVYGIVSHLRESHGRTIDRPRDESLPEPCNSDIRQNCSYCHSGIATADKTCGQCGAPVRKV